MKDGRGNQLFRGGDDVRIFMQDPQNKASMSPDVQDLGNGSYVAVIPLLWEGSPIIKASLSYMKEIILAHQYIRSALKNSEAYSCSF